MEHGAGSALAQEAQFRPRDTPIQSRRRAVGRLSGAGKEEKGCGPSLSSRPPPSSSAQRDHRSVDAWRGRGQLYAVLHFSRASELWKAQPEQPAGSRAQRSRFVTGDRGAYRYLF